MAAEPGALPPFPLMYALSDPLAATGDPDFQFLLFGQAALLARPLARGQPAGGAVAEAAGVFARGRPGG